MTCYIEAAMNALQKEGYRIDLNREQRVVKAVEKRVNQYTSITSSDRQSPQNQQETSMKSPIQSQTQPPQQPSPKPQRTTKQTLQHEQLDMQRQLQIQAQKLKALMAQTPLTNSALQKQDNFDPYMQFGGESTAAARRQRGLNYARGVSSGRGYHQYRGQGGRRITGRGGVGYTGQSNQRGGYYDYRFSKPWSA